MEVGDVVFLKSGGLNMTVVSPYQKKYMPEFGTSLVVYCIWHDDRGVPHGQYYPVSALVALKAK